ncbi:MAG: MFS transporter [Acidobacteria bacterium]|nr:MFS transporter [Acidobacteriota bacterium]
MSDTDVTMEPQSSTRKSAALGLMAVFITYFATIFFFRGIGISQPKVAADLNGMALFSWAISLPALAASFATLLFGKLSDVYGRRLLLMVSLVLYMAGAVLSAVSWDFTFFIAARMILSLGQGALSSLCFATIGDLYAPVERSRWSGLLQIPAGIAAIIGPTMVGMITDQLSWRYFFWLAAILAIISIVLVMGGVTSSVKRTAHKIDFLGASLLAATLAVMIVAFSWAGSTYPWASRQVIGLLAISAILWIILIRVERKAEEPILAPEVMTNRTFLTIAFAGLLSYFAMLAVTMYYPLFLQGVQGTSASLSGKVITPFGIIMAFMGVPTGFFIAKTKRYKWMLITGYTIITCTTFAMIAFNAGTPIWLGILVTAITGFGLGSIPTINTLVSQFAVPKRLLGVAVGAIFAFVFMGNAIAPAILGSAMNQTYGKTLQSSLPAEIDEILDEEALASMANPRVLLSKEAMATLEREFSGAGERGPVLFNETIQAIRDSLEASLKIIFLISAITTLASWFLILTIPEVPIE